MPREFRKPFGEVVFQYLIDQFLDALPAGAAGDDIRALLQSRERIGNRDCTLAHRQKAWSFSASPAPIVLWLESRNSFKAKERPEALLTPGGREDHSAPLLKITWSSRPAA